MSKMVEVLDDIVKNVSAGFLVFFGVAGLFLLILYFFGG